MLPCCAVPRTSFSRPPAPPHISASPSAPSNTSSSSATPSHACAQGMYRGSAVMTHGTGLGRPEIQHQLRHPLHRTPAPACPSSRGAGGGSGSGARGPLPASCRKKRISIILHRTAQLRDFVARLADRQPCASDSRGLSHSNQRPQNSSTAAWPPVDARLWLAMQGRVGRRGQGGETHPHQRH